MLPCLVPVLFAFYLQDVLKFKCKIPAPKAKDLYKNYEILCINAVSDCTSCTPVKGTELEQDLTMFMRYLDSVDKQGSFVKYSYTKFQNS